ncbi:MAG: UPF0280 family protein [Deltaproteobacteria bacterium]|nr:MAG: UPF0280 family protein [Deltaproteobacteria bacterium]
MTWAYQSQIHILDRGRVMAECGPMRLLIFAAVGGVPQVRECVRAAKESFRYLERVALLYKLLKRPPQTIQGDMEDHLARRMIQAAMAVGDQDLTPMAAVAGAIADEVADFLITRGMTRVVVSNGGDIAVRLKESEPVSVGVCPEEDKNRIFGRILLDCSQEDWGVATSGLGGRSLTRGIASAATVVAGDAATADAAATAIANSTFVEDEQVFQAPAEQMDPNTDIPGIPVTLRVGEISEETKLSGLCRGRRKAEGLIEKGVILGAYIAIKGRDTVVGSLGMVS